MFGDLRLGAAARITEGCVLDTPHLSPYRCGSDKAADRRAIVARSNFDYPRSGKDWGSPVVAKDGRLAGVLIGGDLGPESGHQGAYVPVEMILPHARTLEVLRAQAKYKGPQPVYHHAEFEARVVNLASVGTQAPGESFLPATAEGGREGQLFAPDWVGTAAPGTPVVHIPKGGTLSYDLLKRTGLWDEKERAGKLGCGSYGDTTPSDMFFPLAALFPPLDTPVGTDVFERI